MVAVLRSEMGFGIVSTAQAAISRGSTNQPSCRLNSCVGFTVARRAPACAFLMQACCYLTMITCHTYAKRFAELDV
jgi:hypothetical protein